MVESKVVEKEIEDNEYDCGFCTNEETERNYSSGEGGYISTRPCARCAVPRIVAALEKIAEMKP